MNLQGILDWSDGQTQRSDIEMSGQLPTDHRAQGEPNSYQSKDEDYAEMELFLESWHDTQCKKSVRK
jgi:hypothetical protein